MRFAKLFLHVYVIAPRVGLYRVCYVLCSHAMERLHQFSVEVPVKFRVNLIGFEADDAAKVAEAIFVIETAHLKHRYV